jgi:hypothetical protein
VSGYYNSASVEVGDLGYGSGSVADIFERSWVAASRLANPSIFETPGSVPGFGDGSAEVGGVGQVVLRFPETSVDEDDDGVGARACGEAKFSELIGVRAVRYTLAGRRGRQFQD